MTKEQRAAAQQELIAQNEAAIGRLMRQAGLIHITVIRNGHRVDEYVKATPDQQDRPAPAPNTQRTIANPNMLTWKDMDRKTSYKTGSGFHPCPHCDSTNGLRRYYSDNHEECDECGWKGPAKPDHHGRGCGPLTGAEFVARQAKARRRVRAIKHEVGGEAAKVTDQIRQVMALLEARKPK